MSGYINQAKQQKGFTLIELMITVAIIAILAAIGYPLYESQSRKGKRTEAIAALTTAQAEMERYYLNQGSGSGSYLGAAPSTLGLTQSGSYNVTIGNVAAETYTLTATPQGGQANDPCGTFSIDQSGLKAVTGSTVEACWRN